jgi:hypothetical protein
MKALSASRTGRFVVVLEAATFDFTVTTQDHQPHQLLMAAKIMAISSLTAARTLLPAS